MNASMQDNVIDEGDRERLIEAAFAARSNAYSNKYHPTFRVGAALLSVGNVIVKGASVDGVSSGAICAERSAVVSAVSEGITSFLAIAIVSDVAFPITPCGLCRQVLREFCSPRMPCLLVPADYVLRMQTGDQSGGVEVLAFGELLPTTD